jgi:hypothetical protein
VAPTRWASKIFFTSPGMPLGSFGSKSKAKMANTLRRRMTTFFHHILKEEIWAQFMYCVFEAFFIVIYFIPHIPHNSAEFLSLFYYRIFWPVGVHFKTQLLNMQTFIYSKMAWRLPGKILAVRMVAD